MRADRGSARALGARLPARDAPRRRASSRTTRTSPSALGRGRLARHHTAGSRPRTAPSSCARSRRRAMRSAEGGAVPRNRLAPDATPKRSSRSRTRPSAGRRAVGRRALPGGRPRRRAGALAATARAAASSTTAPRSRAETARRLACDASVVLLSERHGKPCGRPQDALRPAGVTPRAASAATAAAASPAARTTASSTLTTSEHWAHGGETTPRQPRPALPPPPPSRPRRRLQHRRANSVSTTPGAGTSRPLPNHRRGPGRAADGTTTASTRARAPEATGSSMSLETAVDALLQIAGQRA